MPQYTLGELSHLLGAVLQKGNSGTVITAIAPLVDAGSGQLSFLADKKYAKYLSSTKAEVVLLTAEYAADCPVACLVVDNPSTQFVQLARLFERKVSQSPGLHPTVIVGEGCCIDSSVSVGPYCVIGNNVTIGKNTIVLPGSVIGDDVKVGDDCLFHAHVTLYNRCIIGSRVIIHSGAVIGSDGFGNVNQGGKWIKSPQLGCIRVGDDVDIGANTTIDCGALGDTIIEEGVKLDNLIQIAHNVHVGAHTAMAAQVGIAGSTKIGKYCMLGGKVAINGHITICDRVIIMATSGVSKSITEPGIYSAAMPALAHKAWMKNMACFNKLSDIYKRVLKIEKTVEKEEVLNDNPDH